MAEVNEISSVSDFVEKIVRLYSQSIHMRKPDVSSITFYRGQSNSEWGITPRLYREGLFYEERSLIEELKRIKPLEFEGFSYFESLIKMQHYGLPTRLLDTTTNPLVGLFFACYGHEQSSQDGALYVFPNLPVFRPTNYAIKIIMKYIFEYSNYKVELSKFIDDIYKKNWLPGPRVRDNILHTISKVPFHAVIPAQSNQRIERQDSTFLLFGMKLHNNLDVGFDNKINNHIPTMTPIEFDNEPVSVWKPSKKFYVLKKEKSQILRELDLLGISWARLFPELEHQSTFVTKMIRQQKRH